ncbi:MAG TPA: RNA-directed DNA polymerase [Planctomycetaceae bacterium]|nr:RNA-directed DNA polymerase [Planctomycetaceae bacterium]
MRFLEFLKRLFFGGSAQSTADKYTRTPDDTRYQSTLAPTEPEAGPALEPHDREKREQHWPVLVPLRRVRIRQTTHNAEETAGPKKYALALPYIMSPDSYLDLTQDVQPELLNNWDLPHIVTPADLADWLQISLGQLGWLTDRFSEGKRPIDARKAHYRYSWKEKRSGGYRLIESPLPMLRQAQEQILDEILESIPPHSAAHGFRTGRSIVTNAEPHVGQAVLVKLDLDNFYTRVRFSRVVAIFRSLGYSREISLWLARLTTSAIPGNLKFPGGQPKLFSLFLPRHLPQGASTSPALANLVAYSLDVRLSGLAKSFGANYTRYGDDLTISGDERFRNSLRLFIPLARQIIRQERFVLNAKKKKIVRPMSQQRVTGVVVNEKTNIPRKEFDRLKATLHNCVRFGPESQNHDQHEHYQAHLRGRIAFVQQLNPHRGEKLLEIYRQINW